MIIAKVLGVKYPTYYTMGSVKTQNNINLVPIDDAVKIKTTIHKLLFEDKFNYVLVGYNKKMFICERHDDTQYSRTDCVYHPYMKLVDV
jgi:hypothetical protein